MIQLATNNWTARNLTLGYIAASYTNTTGAPVLARLGLRLTGAAPLATLFVGRVELVDGASVTIVSNDQSATDVWGDAEDFSWQSLEAYVVPAGQTIRLYTGLGDATPIAGTGWIVDQGAVRLDSATQAIIDAIKTRAELALPAAGPGGEAGLPVLTETGSIALVDSVTSVANVDSVHPDVRVMIAQAIWARLMDEAVLGAGSFGQAVRDAAIAAAAIQAKTNALPVDPATEANVTAAKNAAQLAGSVAAAAESAATIAATNAISAAGNAAAAAVAATSAAAAAAAAAKPGDAMTLAASQNVYLAELVATIGMSADTYAVSWYRNAELLTAGVEAVALRVVKADGEDLVESVEMLEEGTSGLFRHVEATNRITRGSAVQIVVSAMIDGEIRTFARLQGRSY